MGVLPSLDVQRQRQWLGGVDGRHRGRSNRVCHDCRSEGAFLCVSPWGCCVVRSICTWAMLWGTVIALFRVVNIVWSAGNEAWTSLWTVIWQRTDDCLVTRAIDGPSRPLLSVSDKELNVQSYLCQVSLPRNKQTKTSDYPGVKYRL